jgi:hypothetical protein
MNMPRGNATVAVGADKLVIWIGETTGNIYMATPKKKISSAGDKTGRD